MADPTWKDLVKMLKDLQARVNAGPVAHGVTAAAATAEKTRVANLLADMEKKIREECFNVDEQSDFVPPFLK